MMNHILLQLSLLMAGLFLVGSATESPSITPQPSPESGFSQEIPSNPSTPTLTEAEAKQIALNHAGLTETEVNFVKVALDYDDGILEYEVEFYVGNMEYDYEIHAVTGEIRSYDHDMETEHPSTGNTTSPTITEAEAKLIALNHAGLTETEVNFVKVALDYDDGILEYEVEFYVGNKEYDYEIHAVTGEIRSYDHDMETEHPSTGNNTSPTITEAEAKLIALNHAGFTETEVNFVKVALDYDDGILEYEVEFKVGYVEYDYEIHAVTGEIRSYDHDMETEHPSTGNNTSPTITEAEAKLIALNHAGLTETEVNFVKVALDYDDGILEYEVEFKVGYVEYDYEIHGNT